MVVDVVVEVIVDVVVGSVSVVVDVVVDMTVDVPAPVLVNALCDVFLRTNGDILQLDTDVHGGAGISSLERTATLDFVVVVVLVVVVPPVSVVLAHPRLLAMKN